MIQESLVYHVNGLKCVAQLFTKEKTKRPLILVAGTWKGQDKFTTEKARYLAELGYVGIALDVFGNAKQALTDEEAAELMHPLFVDRAELRKRLIAALETARSLEWADTSNIGAIGFCFGGLCVIELMRAGAPLKGVVSFHGVLGDSVGDKKAKTLPTEKIRGRVLALHGFRDPLAPWNVVQGFCDEMIKAGADWELDVYDAVHAFTNPEAHSEGVMFYDEKVCKRSFDRMERFFQTLFSTSDT